MSPFQLHQKLYRGARLGTVLLLSIVFAIGNTNWTLLEPGYQVKAILLGSSANHSSSQESEPVEEIPSESESESTTDLGFPECSQAGTRNSKKRIRNRRHSSSATAAMRMHRNKDCHLSAGNRCDRELRFEHGYRNGIGAPLLI